ncbi:hypothetical protein SK128_005411, partial [Halocaridina rubra]
RFGPDAFSGPPPGFPQVRPPNFRPDGPSGRVGPGGFNSFVPVPGFGPPGTAGAAGGPPRMMGGPPPGPRGPAGMRGENFGPVGIGMLSGPSGPGFGPRGMHAPGGFSAPRGLLGPPPLGLGSVLGGRPPLLGEMAGRPNGPGMWMDGPGPRFQGHEPHGAPQGLRDGIPDRPPWDTERAREDRASEVERFRDERGRGDERSRDLDRDRSRDDHFRDDIPREDRSRDDRSRDDRPRDERDRSRDDRMRDNRSRDDRSRDDRFRDDRSRDERYREDRYRDDRSRGDRFRDDRSRENRQRDDRYRDDRSRDDRPWDGNRYRDDRSRDYERRDEKRPWEKSRWGPQIEEVPPMCIEEPEPDSWDIWAKINTGNPSDNPSGNTFAHSDDFDVAKVDPNDDLPEKAKEAEGTKNMTNVTSNLKMEGDAKDVVNSETMHSATEMIKVAQIKPNTTEKCKESELCESLDKEENNESLTKQDPLSDAGDTKESLGNKPDIPFESDDVHYKPVAAESPFIKTDDVQVETTNDAKTAEDRVDAIVQPLALQAPYVVNKETVSEEMTNSKNTAFKLNVSQATCAEASDVNLEIGKSSINSSSPMEAKYGNQMEIDDSLKSSTSYSSSQIMDDSVNVKIDERCNRMQIEDSNMDIDMQQDYARNTDKDSSLEEESSTCLESNENQNHFRNSPRKTYEVCENQPNVQPQGSLSPQGNTEEFVIHSDPASARSMNESYQQSAEPEVDHQRSSSPSAYELSLEASMNITTHEEPCSPEQVEERDGDGQANEGFDDSIDQPIESQEGQDVDEGGPVNED